MSGPLHWPHRAPAAAVVALAAAEDQALTDLSRRFATGGNQLTAAMRAAYRQALADAGVPSAIIRQLEQRDPA
ncbi:hypothetical protein M9978_02575 [Sphingomonas sp. MG17]|uniref:Uncharacterized protein n=1 Tax=Sphingomonas tagetis TaxID=2949092 RepID=A0A9X2HG81_9SPHN|nr:hypothetical protein [Sphingomonas tagetis]